MLTSHNNKAETINRTELDKIVAKKYFFAALITGEFNESTFPNEQVLELKEGAQVMLIRNDTKPEKRYFNGKIGEVVFIDNDSIKIRFDGEQEILNLEKETWTNKEPTDYARVLIFVFVLGLFDLLTCLRVCIMGVSYLT